MSVRELLDGHRLNDAARIAAQAALSTPWCWPAERELADRAEAIGISPPKPPGPGETALLSVDGEHIGLWHLAPLRFANDAQRPLIREAQEAAMLGWQLAARDAPVVRRLAPIEHGTAWGAHLIAKLGERMAPVVLDGASYGLALYLSSVSLIVDLPLPGDLLALARVAPDGKALPVSRLTRDDQHTSCKLSMIDTWALGVRKILVAADQKASAEAELAPVADRVEVIGVGNISDAIAVAFPNLLDHALRAWRGRPESAAQAIDTLYRQLLLDQMPILRWSGVAAAATQLAKVFPHDDDRARKAHFVLAVARRHDGLKAPLEWPDDSWLLEQPRPIRLALASHIVQSLNDAGDERALASITRAHRYLAEESEQHEEDLRVRGAIGRTLAACGRLEEASQELAKVVAGWMAILQAHQSSHALCEQLRVLGALRRDRELRSVLAEAVARFEQDPRSEASSRCFVAVAAGRALVQVGDAGEGLARMADDAAPWNAAPGHLRWARLRWRARALVALGRQAEAQTERDALEHELHGSDRPDANLFLARIDQALETDQDPGGHLQRLLDSEEDGDLVRRLLGEPVSLDVAAGKIAELYPY